MSDRPKGGRRAEDYPDVVARDRRVVDLLEEAGPLDRNSVARALALEPRTISYALERLRERGLVKHVPHGNEGHGYWAATEEGNEDHAE